MQVGRTAVQEALTKAAQSLNTACSTLSTQSKSVQENVTKLAAQQNVLVDLTNSHFSCYLIRVQLQNILKFVHCTLV